MLPGLVIGYRLLPWFVIGQRGLLVAIHLALLLLQKGGCGGAAAASPVGIHIICPGVGPAPVKIHAPPLHEHLYLRPALVVHSALSHEAGVPGTVAMLGRGAGGRGGKAQHRAEIRCYGGRRGVRSAELRTVCSCRDDLVVFVLGVLVLGSLTFEP